MADLYRLNNGAPAPLPAAIVDPATGFEFRAPFVPADLTRLGYKAAPAKPADTDAKTAQWDDAAGKWIMVDRPPAPEPEPLIIGKGTFLDLLQSAGGLSDEKLLTARKDGRLEALWVKLELYSEVKIDHPSTQAGIQALVGLGYMSQEGAAAALAAWPRR